MPKPIKTYKGYLVEEFTIHEGHYFEVDIREAEKKEMLTEGGSWSSNKPTPTTLFFQKDTDLHYVRAQPEYVTTSKSAAKILVESMLLEKLREVMDTMKKDEHLVKELVRRLESLNSIEA